MATHERELTEPVDLCTPDGKRLNPAARGWSRRPLHRANLRGRWGRTKKWDYWGVLAGDLTVAVTYADVDYLGLATVWWADLATGRTGGKEAMVPLARGIDLPDVPASETLRYDGQGLRLTIADDDETGATTIDAAWTEKDGAPARLHVTADLPAGHESLNVVIPWSETTFQYTSKHQARPVHGELTIASTTYDVGDDAWGVLDVGRGRWPYATNWNWGGGAGRVSDAGGNPHTVGLQLGGRWTVGTGFTENGVIVDGRLSKIGAELEWDYDWDDPMKPWRVTGGGVDLTLTPVYDKHTGVNAFVLRTEVHQVFGRWSGTVTTDDGTTSTLDAIQGFAEESRSRW
jgi:hypothetical protein